MRAAWLVAAVTLAAGPAWAGEHAAAAEWRIEADDVQSLQDGLLALAEERLRPLGISVDRQRAWLSLSGSLPSTHIYVVQPAWRADAQPIPLPLTFELRPGSHAAPTRSILATLAVPLLREVWVASRRLRKGSVVTCSDLSKQRRDIRHVPKLTLALPCTVEPGAVALRDIAAGDVMRSVDIGGAPAVTAGAPVRVSVAVAGINVTTTGVALADAKVGDRIDVRLPRPARVLRTLVTAPGSVQLTDGSP